MKYVITGATSFLGSAIANFLTEQGHIVYALSRKESNNISNLHDSDYLHLVYLDYQDIQNIESYVKKADVFVNLAWIGTTPTERLMDEIHQKNADLALTAMRVAKQIGCKLFVEAGSQAEYGYEDGLTAETSHPHPYTAYGKAKLRVWQEGQQLCRELGIGYIHLRIFSVYGERDHKRTLISTCIAKMLRNETVELSECTQSWNFIYRRDASKMICALMAKFFGTDVCEIFNIASDDTRVLKEFVEEVKTICQSDSVVEYGAVKSDRLLSLNPSISKTLAAIGYMKFTPFIEGIKATKQYMSTSINLGGVVNSHYSTVYLLAA